MVQSPAGLAKVQYSRLYSTTKRKQFDWSYAQKLLFFFVYIEKQTHLDQIATASQKSKETVYSYASNSVKWLLRPLWFQLRDKICMLERTAAETMLIRWNFDV